jgi:hypothetical protein
MTLVADFNSSITVPFQRMRQLLEDTALQAGVVGINDLKVAQRGAGANMSVDVAGGMAYVEITSGTRNGLGHVTSDATTNVVVTASNGTNPRIDQIILRWNDTSIPTGSGNIPTLAVLTGTATGGATLDNRTGAAALPADSIRLADILVPTSSTSVTTANIRDRRPWARGAYGRRLQSTANYTRTSNVMALADANNLQTRVECTGMPIRCVLQASWQAATLGKQISVDTMTDGVATGLPVVDNAAAANVSQVLCIAWDLVPSAGSHLIGLGFLSVDNVTTVALLANASVPLTFTIEEIVRPNNSTLNS